jgi:RNA polymerase sigma-70 factor (ECF subfamily)
MKKRRITCDSWPTMAVDLENTFAYIDFAAVRSTASSADLARRPGDRQPVEFGGVSAGARQPGPELVEDEPLARRSQPASPRDQPSISDGSGPPAAASPVRSTAEDARAIITQLMETYGDSVYSLCLRILRDGALAEDALQQVFLEAHRDLIHFRGQSSPRTWLFSIAIHRCHDVIKTTQRRVARISSSDEGAVTAFADPAPDPGQQLERRRLLAALESCLGHLSSEARVAVLLRFQVELSYDEMAAQLDTKPDTLQTRVRRAMPALRRCLEQQGWTLG